MKTKSLWRLCTVVQTVNAYEMTNMVKSELVGGV